MVKNNKKNNFHVYAKVVPLVLLLVILGGRVEADPVSAERAGKAALKFMQANTGKDREAGQHKEGAVSFAVGHKKRYQKGRARRQ